MVTVRKTHGMVGRSLRKTKIIGKRASPEKGEIPFTIVVDGNYQSLERANIAASRFFGTNRLMVSEIHHGKQFASCTLEQFLKIAKVGEIVWED